MSDEEAARILTVGQAVDFVLASDTEGGAGAPPSGAATNAGSDAE